MHISYRPLWHLLLDRDMNKQKLREVTGLSSSSMAKLGKGESITTEMLVRICSKLDCDLTDIMELVDDNGEPVRNRIKKAEAIPHLSLKNQKSRGELIYTPAIQSA